MIQIKDTKNMIGITIHGDYEDLQTLYYALSDYLRFYFDHQKEKGAYSCYETILGLCYDIRHAFQGDRNIESVENNHEGIAQLARCIYQLDELDEKSIAKERKKYKNGNLYFNVEVLYPWAIYYLFTLQAISEDVYQHAWFETDEFGYTEYQAERDLALIQFFVHLLWGRLHEHLPEDAMRALWDHTRICNHIEYYFDFSDLYMEWLCTYWINAFFDKNERHHALPLVCFELSSILDECEEDLEAVIEEAETKKRNASGKTGDIDNADDTNVENTVDVRDEMDRNLLIFQASLAQITLHGLNLYYKDFFTYNDPRTRQVPYLSQVEFETKAYSYVEEHGQFTEESYNEWLDDQLGAVEWDELEW